MVLQSTQCPARIKAGASNEKAHLHETQAQDGHRDAGLAGLQECLACTGQHLCRRVLSLLRFERFRLRGWSVHPQNNGPREVVSAMTDGALDAHSVNVADARARAYFAYALAQGPRSVSERQQRHCGDSMRTLRCW
jgi:hypothetical protein